MRGLGVVVGCGLLVFQVLHRRYRGRLLITAAREVPRRTRCCVTPAAFGESPGGPLLLGLSEAMDRGWHPICADRPHA